MTVDLVTLLGLGARELVAFTGGGGKTTLLLSLNRELAGRGHRVIVTTTTKMGLDQTIGERVCWSADTRQINAALGSAGSVFVLSQADDHKVIGYGPEVVDNCFAATEAEYVLVEADGARRRPLKAPAEHEPVVPSAASVVVVVVGIDAIGQTLAVATHRPDQAAALTGLSGSDLITPASAGKILAHRDGGLRGVPPDARVVVAINKVRAADRADADALRAHLMSTGRIGSVVVVPFGEVVTPSGR